MAFITSATRCFKTFLLTPGPLVTRDGRTRSGSVFPRAAKPSARVSTLPRAPYAAAAVATTGQEPMRMGLTATPPAARMGKIKHEVAAVADTPTIAGMIAFALSALARYASACAARANATAATSLASDVESFPRNSAAVVHTAMIDAAVGTNTSVTSPENVCGDMSDRTMEDKTVKNTVEVEGRRMISPSRLSISTSLRSSSSKADSLSGAFLGVRATERGWSTLRIR
mmetsp:Transcript_28428/g.53255  ORF Transcript_28428/g.53255 Transcript_28428/m.53255 type:complete len:228 (+) Transcript_28428:997-1680(+)